MLHLRSTAVTIKTHDCKNLPMHFSGSGYPLVQCNHVSNSLYGFNFEQNCMGTIWRSNVMCDNWAGLALTNNGVIGQQGGPGGGNGNEWSTACNPWGTFLARNETYCLNSNPNLSPLFVVSGPPWEPINNGAVAFNPGGPYLQGLGLQTASSNTNDPCGNMFLPTPHWKVVERPLSIQSAPDLTTVLSIFPNPASDVLTFKHAIKDLSASIRILDLTGREVASFKLEQNPVHVNVSLLAPQVYIVEATYNSGRVLVKKFVRTQ